MTESTAIQFALQAHQAGDLARAEELYREILAHNPQQLEALHMLGMLSGQRGDFKAAVEFTTRAIQLRPDQQVLHYNLGLALKGAGQLDEAIAALGRAIQLNPDDAEAHSTLGSVLHQKGQLDEAVVFYRKAIALKPGLAEAHNNLGNALKELGLLEESIAAHRRTIGLRPDFAEAHSNLAVALQDVGRLDEALASCLQAVGLKPGYAAAHNNLGNILKDMARLDEAIDAYRRAVALNVRDAASHSNLVYAVQFHPAYDADAILREAVRFDAVHGRVPGESRLWKNDRSADRRLRIGYVAPDFREHCQSLFTVPLLANHDHGQLEIFCYADVPRPDARTKQLMGYADVWRPTQGLSDEKIAEMVRADGVDILVDLSMHMARARPLLFARKPAPVQVAWLAYPGTTGLAAMNYRLTDPHLDPPGETDRCYSETSIRLPNTFWCYDPLTTEPAVNALPSLETGTVTFGCFNNFCKINDGVLSLWAKVLSAAPGSRLLLLAPEGSPRRWVLDRLARDGIGRDRVEFALKQPRLDYLQLYHRIDIALDTFPYNGHTTSLDSFWMGIPVVTLVGRTVAGRAGWSQLSNLKMTELAARSDEQFVRIAAELANDRPRLAELRRTLRPRMEASPLMDGTRFARGVEQAYREMWRTFCSRPR